MKLNKEIYLTDLKDAEPAVIEDVPDHSLFAPLGVRKDKMVCIQTRHPFSGPLVLRIDNRQIAVSRHLAEKIRVKVIC